VDATLLTTGLALIILPLAALVLTGRSRRR